MGQRDALGDVLGKQRVSATLLMPLTLKLCSVAAHVFLVLIAADLVHS